MRFDCLGIVLVPILLRSVEGKMRLPKADCQEERLLRSALLLQGFHRRGGNSSIKVGFIRHANFLNRRSFRALVQRKRLSFDIPVLRMGSPVHHRRNRPGYRIVLYLLAVVVKYLADVACKVAMVFEMLRQRHDVGASFSNMGR